VKQSEGIVRQQNPSLVMERIVQEIDKKVNQNRGFG
jgi:hypothetical protein